MRKSYEMDMCSGPLFSKLILFSIPLILSSILQLLFNTADIIVVGRFSGPHALAAVGSTSSLINLLINLFMGISIGANVVVGRYYGARDYKSASETVHTAMVTAMVGGIIMVVVGYVLSKPMLQLMGTPDDVLALSVLYIRVYFLGMPAFMVYTFGASVLRALGDTKRPLYYLTVSGIINVIFNLFFVMMFHMGVAGVALATIIAQWISAAFILISLEQSEGVLHFGIKDFEFHKDKLFEMLRVGLPAGLQGIIFNISNVLIQSSINSFGSTVVAGNTAASNIESFVYVSMNSVYQTALSFTSQNYGGKQFHRIDKILVQCLFIVSVVGFVMGFGAYLGGHTLLGIYSTSEDVITYGMARLGVVSASYFLCGIMDVFVGSLRGIGYSIIPMFVSLAGACLFRIVWIFTIFALYHTQFTLYISYPISWVITSSIHLVCYLLLRKRAFNRAMAQA